MPNLENLTGREREALELLAHGHDAKSAARALGVSVNSINERLRDARRKLGVTSSREAARILLESTGEDPQKIRDEKIGVDRSGGDMSKPAPDGRARFVVAGVVALLLIAITALALSGQAAKHPPPAETTVTAAAAGASLIYAVRQRDIAALRELLESGTDPNAATTGEGSALIAAVRLGDRAAVRLLLEHGARADFAAPGDGSPLIAAANLGDSGLIDEFIARGADVNAIVPGDETPLIAAARSGRLAAVDALVKHGADVNLKALMNADRAPEWASPLGEALKRGHSDVADYLTQHGAKP